MEVDLDSRGYLDRCVSHSPLTQACALEGKKLTLSSLSTFSCASVSPWLIQDFPDTAKFLTEPESELSSLSLSAIPTELTSRSSRFAGAFVIARLKESSGEDTTSEKFSWGPIMDSLKDWKTYLGMIIYAGSDGPLCKSSTSSLLDILLVDPRRTMRRLTDSSSLLPDAFSLFTPSIINSLGFTAVKANLLSGELESCSPVSDRELTNLVRLAFFPLSFAVPIYTFACFVTVGLGFVRHFSHFSSFSKERALSELELKFTS